MDSFIWPDGVFVEVQYYDQESMLRSSGTGKIRFYYPNGNFCAEGEIRNFRFVDKLIVYHPDRSINFIAQYNSFGVLDGTINFYYSKTHLELLNRKYQIPIVKKEMDFRDGILLNQREHMLVV
jgi:antitoxin component YwqK of YwqJK toxin-antitoxin module